MREQKIPIARREDCASGAPQLLYVSNWEQKVMTLPRSLHNHPDFAEFTFILEGQGICELDGVFYPIERGDLIVCNRGLLHDEFIDSRPLSLVSVAAGRVRLPGLPENCIVREGITPIFQLNSEAQAFRTLLALLTDEVKSARRRRECTCQSLFLAVFYRMLDLIDTYNGPAGGPLDSAADLAHQIRAHVDRHITEELSVKDIAARFSISPSYLARIFKSSIGTSLSQYIIRRRLGEAQTLLLNSDLPISEVAARVGYPNQSYFTKLFTQSFHVSPLQYRKISSQQLIRLPEAAPRAEGPGPAGK